jgi:UDP:flavonoid glycosyltransferase YjiC (YdhE family)
VPRNLPPNVQVFGYQPFSALLPRAALLVYHGGIGTLAQTIRAGIPHLVVPNGHDQFDNAWRIGRLGLGQSVPQSRYRAGEVSRMIREILDDAAVGERCAQAASRIDSDGSLRTACELIEGLGRA